MSLRKYNFEPGSGCLFIKAQLMTAYNVSKPMYFMIDEMPREYVVAMMEEYSDEQENICGSSFRGVSWSVIEKEDLPQNFLEKAAEMAEKAVANAITENEWYKAYFNKEKEKV